MEDSEMENNQRPVSFIRSESSGSSGRGTCIHITALDGIVNVNSLFTLAVFVGLAWNPTDPSLLSSSACSPGAQAAKDLVSFHVFAFSAFLFSSLVALCLKQAIRLAHPRVVRSAALRINKALLRAGIMASAVGSVCGCGFLMLALVNVVQIKLGKFSCGGAATLGAIIPLVTLIPIGVLIYVGIVLYAFTR